MFLSLNTGRAIHRHQWKRLPITEQIIKRVEEIATKEKQPYIANNFKYKCNKNLVDDSCDDGDDGDEVSYSSNNEESDEAMTVTDVPLVDIHEIADDINERAIDHEVISINEEDINSHDDNSTDTPNNHDGDNHELTSDEKPSHQELITDHAIEDEQNNQPDTQDDDMGTVEDVTHQKELTEG